MLFRFRQALNRSDLAVVLDASLPWVTWMPNCPAPAGDSVRFSLPGALDPNHLDGIGALHLLAHLPIGAVGSPGALNLNGGTVTIKARKSADFQANGNALRIWVCSNFPAGQSNILDPDQATNWCYAAKDLLDDIGTGPGFSTSTTGLGTSGWTYAGVNFTQQGDAVASRYGQRANDPQSSIEDVSATLHICFVGPRSDQPPTGTIDIESIEIIPANSPTPPVSTVTAAFAQPTPNLTALAIAALARTGDLYSAALYGSWLFYGQKGFVRDPAGAIPPLAAAAATQPIAAAALATAYAGGEGVDRDAVQARALLAVFPDDPVCNYLLGTMMLHGIGGALDAHNGLLKLVYAAAHVRNGDKNTSAMLDAGRQYLRTGPDYSYSQAYIWLRRAQNAGLVGRRATVAQADLAVCVGQMPGYAPAELEADYVTGWQPTPV